MNEHVVQWSESALENLYTQHRAISVAQQQVNDCAEDMRAAEEAWARCEHNAAASGVFEGRNADERQCRRDEWRLYNDEAQSTQARITDLRCSLATARLALNEAERLWTIARYRYRLAEALVRGGAS